ncbi:MAG TPA: sigma-70 family RNA polymerase sigma factor [Polyangiaceae bacterium]|nr:sigma-70 family RNA polymerase sigma factor [Polyangiaceae bacterium]
MADDAPLWGGASGGGEGEAEDRGGANAGGASAGGAGEGEVSEGEVSEGEALRAAVAGALTSKQREVVELHFFEGLSQGEIARRLGVSQQVVQKRLHGDRRAGKLVGGALPRLREALAGRFARP